MPKENEDMPHHEPLLNVDNKEELKLVIDKSEDYQQLYDNAIKILTSMEANFKEMLHGLWRHISVVRNTRFDEKLDVENPVTIFEKKGSELLKKSKDILEILDVENAASHTMELIWRKKLDQEWKNLMVEELRNTRKEAIQNFKDDIADEILSNDNNIDLSNTIAYWQILWMNIFRNKEDMKEPWEFESYINEMSLSKLMLGTFNINEWSWAFNKCYWKIKEKLNNENLFDFIDSQEKDWDWTKDALKYSALKSLFERRKLTDLDGWIKNYSKNENILDYIKTQINEDEDFKIAFLTSIQNIDESSMLRNIAENLKIEDENVRKACEEAKKIDKADCFRDWKINGLVIYDDEWHWWGSAFFQSELQSYEKKWFIVSPKEENINFIRYILKKWSDSITMVQLKIGRKQTSRGKNIDNYDYGGSLGEITKDKDFNLFALRGHCYSTDKIALALWSLNAVWEWDIFINGGCWGSMYSWNHYQSWINWLMFAYVSEWKWASTQDLINRIISFKNSWKNFSDVLEYYNWLSSESWNDGYFAFNTERPDSISAQYKKLTIVHEDNETWENDLVEHSRIPPIGDNLPEL